MALESQLSFDHSAWKNRDAKPQADSFENGLLRGAFPGRGGDLTAGLTDGILEILHKRCCRLRGRAAVVS